MASKVVCIQLSPLCLLFLLTTLLLISSSVSARMSQVEKTNPRPSSNVSAQLLQAEKTNPGPSSSVSARMLLQVGPHDCNWLVQTWPIGYCYKRDCRHFQWSMSEFTIHGLWPVDCNGNRLRIPFGHRMEGKDDICKVIPQEQCVDMPAYWPSLKCKYNAGLWLKQWNKHGRYQNSLGPTDYIVNTIRVVKDMKLLNIFAAAGIVPSNDNHYQIRSYITAITKKIQAVYPLLLCNPKTYKDGLPVLAEVVICVDTRAEGFVRCPVQPNYKSLCPCGPIWFLAPIPVNHISP